MTPARRSLLHLVLGIWLGISACTIVGAVMSFRAAGLPPGGRVEALDAEARAQAARFNLRMFGTSGVAQVLLGGMAVTLAAWPPRAPRTGVVALVLAAAVALLLTGVVVPRTAQLGRDMLESVEPDEHARAAMQRLHRAYAILDLAKSLGLVVAFVSTARRLHSEGTPPGASLG